MTQFSVDLKLYLVGIKITAPTSTNGNYLVSFYMQGHFPYTISVLGREALEYLC